MGPISSQNRSSLQRSGRRDYRVARDRLVEQALITQRRLSLRRTGESRAAMRSAA
jgi:hypothetical protein